MFLAMKATTATAAILFLLFLMYLTYLLYHKFPGNLASRPFDTSLFCALSWS